MNGPADKSDLLAVIAQVRRRWRLKLALRGAALSAAILALTLVAGAYGLEVMRFAPAAIIGLRILMLVALAAVAAFFLARPLLRRVTDEQVALYLEEHEPSLEAAIVSAIDAGRTESVSPALVERLVETAIERCEAVDRGRRVDQPHMRRYSGVLAGVVVAVLLLFALGPSYLRHGASALLRVSQNVEAASPYRIDVRPGSATVPRGSDQTIAAQLVGFQAEQVELLVKKAASGSFERVPLIRSTSDAGSFETMLFDIAAQTEYFIEAAGVRSPVFTLKIVDLPYVDRLELEFRFPAYTGMAPQKLDNGGDIVVLKGTEVSMRVHSTIPSPAGRALLHDKDTVALTRQTDGTLTGTFVADRDGFYRIELDGPKGEKVSASPQFTIDVLNDQPPSVHIAKPQRDTKVSPIEEVFIEAQADDDFGVSDLSLVYSVNGGAPKTLKLAGGRPAKEVTAGHTFYLEEFGVQPGDAVSYYAVAKDQHESRTSDMYFLQIRPFRKDFKPATSMSGGGGGGGGAGQQVGALSQQQKQIIAATFNTVRDRKNLTPEKLRENVVLLTLSQSRLREQVDELVGRMNSRLVEPDPAFKKIAELLPQAVTEMRDAEKKLQAQAADKALEPEQRALQFLQKAEEEYELQVSMNRNQGGGGGGGAGSIAEDLADLFDLELDKLANQYEQTQSASQQSGDQQIDELMEKLKELARRQEQEAERQRRRAALQQNMQNAGGGAGQRALAEQAEEAARRLERLSREQNRPDLREAARRMQEAADAMRRAAANGDPSGGAQASAALERLREAQRQLERQQTSRGQRDVNDALRKAEEIAREQREIASEVGELGQPGSGGARQEKVQRLNQRKDALEGKVADLEKQLDRTAGDIRKDQRDAARKLTEAANGIRDDKIKEKIRYSKAVAQAGTPEQARTFEDSIGANIADLQKRLGEAASASASGRAKTDRMAEALDKARQMARGVDSLDQRLRDRQGARDRQGSQNRRDQQGQQGREGQQGQQGQRGQQGQSGQQGGQGGQNQSGRETQEGRGGDGNTVGGAYRDGNWGGGSRRPGDYLYSPEDIRQFRGEWREWIAQGQELRQQLRGQGVDVTELDEILKSLKALDDDRVYKDAGELERLQTYVSEGLKRFEYGLRRKAENADQQLFLSGSDEVPAGFRDLVEEYYRSLAKKKQR